MQPSRRFNLRFNPYLEIVLATLIWGMSGVVVKLLALPPTIFSFFRMGVPALILLLFFYARKEKFLRGNNGWMLFASSLNALRMFLWFVAIAAIPITEATILVYTWPVFAIILSMIFLKEHLPARNIALLAVALIGIFLVYAHKGFSLADAEVRGMTIMLLSSLIYAFAVIIFKKEAHHYSRLEIVFWQNSVGAVVFIPFLFFVRPLPTPAQAGIAVVYAFFIGLVAFALFFSALKRITASTASSMTYLEIVSAGVYSIIFFGEQPSWNVIAGALLIVGSVLLMKREKVIE